MSSCSADRFSDSDGYIALPSTSRIPLDERNDVVRYVEEIA